MQHCRKTSANNIAQANKDSPHLVDLFLGHTQKTMAKHYASPLSAGTRKQRVCQYHPYIRRDNRRPPTVALYLRESTP